MSYMSFQGGAVHQYVIQKNQDKLSQEWAQNVIHDALKCCWCIGEAKRHDSELKMAMVCFKSCFVLLSSFHPHLVITRPHV